MPLFQPHFATKHAIHKNEVAESEAHPQPPPNEPDAQWIFACGGIVDRNVADVAPSYDHIVCLRLAVDSQRRHRGYRPDNGAGRGSYLRPEERNDRTDRDPTIVRTWNCSRQLVGSAKHDGMTIAGLVPRACMSGLAVSTLLWTKRDQ
jgi:hypothetical protein